MADDMSLNPTRDDFSALLDESMGGRDFMEGTVVKGIVVGIEKDFAIIDVGLKTEGRVSVKEFGVDEDGKSPISIGATVEVFLERVENAMGEAVISRDKARREEA
ncbi:MAG: S1 RNA-binding domain-containing protein, partial [Pseudomonadota bacterium]